MTSPATWSRATQISRDAALMVYELHGDVNGACDALEMQQVECGHVALRAIAGVDDALCMRPAPDLLIVSIHGGLACAHAMESKLLGAGVHQSESSTSDAFAEAENPVEACVLWALGVAQSLRAVPLLLDQPARWQNAHEHKPTAPAALHRLLRVPTVAVIGFPNVGKSSLVNAIAGREVAIAFDMPGTTRDMVSVRVEMDGLVVDLVDCPGLDEVVTSDDPERAIQLQAQARAKALLASAELVISCSDGKAPFLCNPIAEGTTPVLRVLTKCDMGGTDVSSTHCVTSAHTRTGIDELAHLVRRTLVPDEAINSPLPWCFWDSLGLADPREKQGC
ncbi:MAG: 50S ribosome-binding GTPase [Phycisphaeraceae bacterium]|nr:50S ribosome-binding GTPase [Phycisphaerales bacterium]MCB9860725.1 50S ribosome-binding GTPase [Phycisphaeraceae bacterium]